MDFVTVRELRAVRAERFAANVRRMQREAVEKGLDEMSKEEINAEIAAARKERRERNADRH